ncbi:MAG: MucB/RseB C-terminal domain-containing protein [Proteobacteria bacterium]|nr:MucB/RseB C-terminal domain-containing protein [Pseudomonadota bacterium]
MRFAAAVIALCAALAQPTVHAEAMSDPLTWLGRIASAGQKLSYVGTFMYQSRGASETSRIAHRMDATGEYERLEVLDGSPREVIRSGNEVRCVLPEQKTVIIDQAGGRRAFPARLPASFSNLAENYRIRKGDVGRVAGYEAQSIVLEPRDDLRFGYVLWADVQSGLLLKSRMVDEGGETIEQFAFSDVRIGGDVGPDLLKSRFDQSGGWRVVNARGSEISRSEGGWVLRSPLPGYALMSVMRRPLGRERGEAIHMVYGDGLAAISVFIEPLAGQAASPAVGALSSGAINIYKRIVDRHLVTALGEVPARAVQRLADGIEHSAQ